MDRGNFRLQIYIPAGNLIFLKRGEHARQKENFCAGIEVIPDILQDFQSDFS
jgi:hypothetical protein